MIDTKGLPFQKPAAAEGKVTLTPLQRKGKLDKLCADQHMRCAECSCKMTREQFRMNTATLDHIVPDKMGNKKNDADSNLRAVCWKCNFIKGSKRK